MNAKRLAVLASAIALAMTSAFAQATQVRTPISFTLSGCPTLPTGLIVKGTGDAFLVVNSRTDQNGNTVVQRNNLVTGTATDSNGATYIFNYFSHVTLTVPPGGFPFTLAGTDHFNLVGDGQANQLEVHFVARATFTSPTTFTIDLINVHGTPFGCDPI